MSGVTLRRATASSASSARRPSPSAATRSRRRGSFSTRPVAAVSERARQQRRPGRTLRDGAGRVADGRAVPGAAAHVQGAAARDLLGAVLRDRRAARLRARLLDPDDLTAADRLGRARARRGPLGAVTARVHARLQPLDRARDPRGVPAAAREPRHARRRESTQTACRSRTSTTASARTTRRSDRLREECSR